MKTKKDLIDAIVVDAEVVQSQAAEMSKLFGTLERVVLADTLKQASQLGLDIPIQSIVFHKDGPIICPVGVVPLRYYPSYTFELKAQARHVFKAMLDMPEIVSALFGVPIIHHLIREESQADFGEAVKGTMDVLFSEFRKHVEELAATWTVRKDHELAIELIDLPKKYPGLPGILPA